MPADLLEQTKPYHAGTYKVVQTTEALRDLMYAGGTCHVGSMLAVSSYGDPISRPQGRWNHDMNVYGFDNTNQYFNDCIWMFNQSWGKWNQVVNIPNEWLPIPEGAFFITENTMKNTVRQGGTVVFFDGEFFSSEPLTNEVI